MMRVDAVDDAEFPTEDEGETDRRSPSGREAELVLFISITFTGEGDRAGERERREQRTKTTTTTRRRRSERREEETSMTVVRFGGLEKICVVVTRSAERMTDRLDCLTAIGSYGRKSKEGERLALYSFFRQ